jgi:RNA polymerase sigma factor (sigma-70 family)
MAVTETSARANAALDELYRQHVGDVYRYTYAVLGNHADAEDVTQTTFVNALRALERGERPDDPSRWLVVIAHNLVRQRWRQAASRPALVELETDVPDSPEDDEEAIELEELVRALQRIPPAQREALVMRELEGRPYREIASVLGLSTAALETLLFRARRSLAEEIENVVTCQNAELAISKRLDGRLSRKERRRLDEHLAECADCARLAKAEDRQRKAFKGLALLPLPIGLALFKGTPTAAAATLPTIGLGTAGSGAAGTGAAGAGATAGAAGGAAAGGSLAGGIVVKVAAVAAAATVATGVGYKGVQAVRDTPAKPAPAEVKAEPDSKAAGPRVAPPSFSRSAGAGKAAGHAKKQGAKRKPAAGTKPGRSKHNRVAAPGLVHKPSTPASDRAAGPNANASANGKAGGSAQPEQAKATKAKATKAKATKAKATKTAKDPKAKAPKRATPPAKGGGAEKPEAPKRGAPVDRQPRAGSEKPSAPTKPSGPSTPIVPPTADSPTGTAPAETADQPTATDTTQDDGTTTPPPSGTTTPPTTGAPVAPPSTQDPPPVTTPTTPPSAPPTPPTEPSGGSSDPPNGSTEEPSNPGWEHGKKLGHHKGNHDGKHPGDS